MIPFTTISTLFIIKIATIVILTIYLVFALVVVRQTKLMTDTLQLGFESFVIMLSYLHLIFAVLVFFSALVIL